MGGIEGHIIGGMVFLNHGANRIHFRVCLLLIHWPSVNFASFVCFTVFRVWSCFSFACVYSLVWDLSWYNILF